MSASREKKKRAESREGGSAPETRDVGAIVQKRVTTILVVIAALAVVALVLFGQGIPQQYITAVTIEGENISIVEMNYNYINQASSFVQNNSYILQMYGVDFSRPLSEQMYDEETTWGDYILNTTLNTLKETVLFSQLAKQEGIGMTEKDLKDIENAVDNIRKSAQTNNMSVNKFLSTNFGRGMNEKIFRACMERAVLATRYMTVHRGSFSYSESQISSHYDENKRDFDLVTYRQMALDKEMSEEERTAAEEAGEDLEEVVETPLGEMTVEEKKAYDKCVQLSEEPTLSPENFNELAKPLTPEERWEYYDEDPDFALFTDQTYSDSELNNWLFDSGRKYGDVSVIDTGSTFNTVMFLGRTRNEYDTVNIRDILIQPAEDNDSAWNEAEMRAGNIFRPIEGGVSESEFAKLADDNTEAYTVEAGGLVYDVSHDDFDEEVDSWLFDESRKPGDVAMLKGGDGYHIMYFVSVGRPKWQAQVETALRDASYEEFESGKVLASGNPVRNDLGLMFLLKI